MIIVIHRNHDPKESADFWHSTYLFITLCKILLR